MLLFNEDIRLFIKDPSLSKDITLYHRTYLKLDKISPMSRNTGDRFSKPRMSSFWCTSQRIPKLFAIHQAICDHFKGVLKHPCILNKDITGVYIDESIKQDAIQYLKSIKFYIYQKTIPRKYVGIGQSPSTEEFTIDIDVVPDKVFIYNYNDIKSLIKFSTTARIEEITDYMKHRENRRTIFDFLLYNSMDEWAKRNKDMKTLRT